MVSIKEIAKKAHVSIGTVDRVIHNRGRVSANTKEKIERIIKELNYVPNVFARNLKLDKKFVFGVIVPVPSQDSNYWETPVQGIMKAQVELKSHKVNVKFFYYDKYCPESFRKVYHRAMHSGVDGFLIAPVILKIADELIKKYPPVKPYVFFDSKIPNIDYLAYIGQDSYQSGVVSAKLVSLLLTEQGTVAAIRALPEDYHIEERIRGFQNYFKKNKKINVITCDLNYQGNKKITFALAQKILNNNKDLKAIFISNALTHQIAEFMSINRLKMKIHLIGYDLIKENKDYLKKGFIDFLINQMPETQGYQGIYSLFRNIVLGEEVEKEIMMPIDIVTKENIIYCKN
jgi:LacI family transcriptional regulator